MSRRWPGALLLILLGGLLAGPAQAALQWPLDEATVNRAAAELRQLLVAGEVAGQPLQHPEALRQFYLQRRYRLGWVGPTALRPVVTELLEVMSAAPEQGLPEPHTQLTRLQRRIEPTPDSARQLAELDLLLSDAFITQARQRHGGALSPEQVDPDWHIERGEFDGVQLLSQALRHQRVAAVLAALEPRHAGYRRLREVLARYRRIAAAGGWPRLEGSRMLGEGDRGSEVARLRERLVLEGVLAGEAEERPGRFDAALAAALARYQASHGLAPSGVLDPQTRAELNRPVTQRIEQLRVNLERWRWFPRRVERRFVLVNTAAYQLQAIEDGRTALEMAVVVGREGLETPQLKDRISALTVNPYWYVPHNIFRRDYLEPLSGDPAYLGRHNMRLFRRDGPDLNHELAAEGIDWGEVAADSERYILRQEPGPENALGQLKFVLNNPYHIYLHDTPRRGLFSQRARAFSSGCVRLERPMELVRFALAGDPHWSEEQVAEMMASGIQETLPLSQPLPTYLVYWTAWVDDRGVMHFRDDIYGRDRVMAEALQAIDAAHDVAGIAAR